MAKQIPVSDYPYELKDMVRIKQTKSIAMKGNTEGVVIILNGKELFIPRRIAFQLLRGLISYTQRFYRKKK